jgi:hypothetical protein
VSLIISGCIEMFNFPLFQFLSELLDSRMVATSRCRLGNSMSIKAGLNACLSRAHALTAKADAARDYETMLLCDRLAEEWLRLARLITTREPVEASDYDAIVLLDIFAQGRAELAASGAQSECSSDEPQP